MYKEDLSERWQIRFQIHNLEILFEFFPYKISVNGRVDIKEK